MPASPKSCVLLLDPALKICIVVSRPSRKNEDAASVGHPKCCDALDQINKQLKDLHLRLREPVLPGIRAWV
jgi:hypothetical protein